MHTLNQIRAKRALVLAMLAGILMPLNTDGAQSCEIKRHSIHRHDRHGKHSPLSDHYRYQKFPAKHAAIPSLPLRTSKTNGAATEVAIKPGIGANNFHPGFNERSTSPPVEAASRSVGSAGERDKLMIAGSASSPHNLTPAEKDLPAISAGCNKYPDESHSGKQQFTFRGMTLTAPSRQSCLQFHPKQNSLGAVVTQVSAGSKPAAWGIVTGNIIIEIDNHPVASFDEALTALGKQDDLSRTVFIRIMDDYCTRGVTLVGSSQ